MQIYPTRRPNGSITIYYAHGTEEQKGTGLPVLSKRHFFIGHVVKKSHWVQPEDENKKRTGDGFVKKGAPDADKVNQAIQRVKKKLKQIIEAIEEEERDPTAQLVAERYKEFLANKRNATKALTSGILARQLDVMAMAWAWHAAGKGLKGKVWKKATKQSIKESLDAFEEYIKTIKGERKLLKSDLSLQLIQDYEEHLFNKGLVKNAVGKRLKHVKQFLSTFEDLSFNPNKIKIYQIEKTPIALTEIELEKIETVVLPNEMLNQCRDMFLMGCYTSLRISDLLKLGPQHFQGNEIQILQEKNEKSFRFPITPQIRQILERYAYKLPKLSDAEINRNIKDVARLAGIDQPVELTKELKDKTVRYTKKKYEIISTHMAVKTFITLGLKWGLSIPDIAAIAGKHIRTIQGHYAAGDKAGATEKLRELWEQRTVLKVI